MIDWCQSKIIYRGREEEENKNKKRWYQFWSDDRCLGSLYFNARCFSLISFSIYLFFSRPTFYGADVIGRKIKRKKRSRYPLWTPNGQADFKKNDTKAKMGESSNFIVNSFFFCFILFFFFFSSFFFGGSMESLFCGLSSRGDPL